MAVFEQEQAGRRVQLKSRLSELDKLHIEIAEYCSIAELPEDTAFHLNLACEEIVANIIAYGYEDEEEHIITIELFTLPEQIVIVVQDDGLPFNPLEQTLPNTTLTIEDRPIGGLGLLFVRRLMESIDYTRALDKNCLRMTVRRTK